MEEQMSSSTNEGVDRFSRLKEVFVAPTPNALVNTASPQGRIAGFWQGLWHGVTFPFMFLVSLFKKDTGLYEAHNNGAWYHFGYLMGLSISLGSNSGVKVQVGDKQEQEDDVTA